MIGTATATEISRDKLDKMTPRQLAASFAVVDDLLWQAVNGRLPELGATTITRSGRIGPLIELAMAAAAFPDAYSRTTIEPPIFRQIEHALSEGIISGAGAKVSAVSACLV